jgi:hypothetical protein
MQLFSNFICIFHIINVIFQKKAKTNDDKILEAAVNLCEKVPGNSRCGAPTDDPNMLKLMRNVVLLTGDRGLAVKAISERVFPSFFVFF